MTTPRRELLDPISRRAFLAGSLVGAGTICLPISLARAEQKPAALEAAIESSPLIYVSPLRGDGRECRCQAEVWFVARARDLYVVTSSQAWRARAIGEGLGHARIWVGDYGPWKKSDGRYKQAPSFDAAASIDGRSADRESILDLYARKYESSWKKWGPRFHEGLADGSRVLIRYSRGPE